MVALRDGPNGLLGLVLTQTYAAGIVTGLGQVLAFTKLHLWVGLYS